MPPTLPRPYLTTASLLFPDPVLSGKVEGPVIAPTCAALGLARASFYRHQRPPAMRAARRPSPRALSALERAGALAVLHEPRFVDLAPAQVYTRLLDDNRYLCSERTLYRILAANTEVRERRDQLRHPVYQKPELLATAPNQVWSWDITKLLGPVKWTYFYLYVLLDIYSRYVTGWMLATQESHALAQQLIEETCRRQGIAPGQLTTHSDRGPSMTSKPVALLLADLGVTKSFSRPHTSNDNPYSEAQFKTLKYRPEFPARFGSLQDGRGYCQTFFGWYNTEHHHSGIGMMTPEAVHYGRAPRILAARQQTLDTAFAGHPERFVRHPPQHQPVRQQAWINPPKAKPDLQAAPGSTIAMLADLRVVIPMNLLQTEVRLLTKQVTH
jgi:putative transposase